MSTPCAAHRPRLKRTARVYGIRSQKISPVAPNCFPFTAISLLIPAAHHSFPRSSVSTLFRSRKRPSVSSDPASIGIITQSAGSPAMLRVFVYSNTGLCAFEAFTPGASERMKRMPASRSSSVRRLYAVFPRASPSLPSDRRAVQYLPLLTAMISTVNPGSSRGSGFVAPESDDDVISAPGSVCAAAEVVSDDVVSCPSSVPVSVCAAAAVLCD